MKRLRYASNAISRPAIEEAEMAYDATQIVT